MKYNTGSHIEFINDGKIIYRATILEMNKKDKTVLMHWTKWKEYPKETKDPNPTPKISYPLSQFKLWVADNHIRIDKKKTRSIHLQKLLNDT